MNAATVDNDNVNDSNVSSEVVILRHPLPRMSDDGHQGSLFVYGRQDSKHLVIMCAGFPDNQSPFSSFASLIATECDCLVGVTCLPGYDDTISLSDYPHLGFNFTDWPVALREAVKCLRNYSTRPVDKTTLTGVFHDWGVVAGCMYTNQCLDENQSSGGGGAESDLYTPDRIVLVDILPPPGRQASDSVIGHDNNTTYEKMLRMLYMGVLALQFTLSRFVPFFLSVSLFTIGMFVCRSLNAFPISTHDVMYFRDHIQMKSKSDLQRMWYMAYPYKCIFELALQGKIDTFIQQHYRMPSDLTKTPVLHLYGASKPYSLSDANGLVQLEREKESSSTTTGRTRGPSRVVKVDDAGHWCYVTQPEVCLKAFRSFFDDCGVDQTNNNHQ